ncbi:ABC transporter substrate-binding protein [Verticiella sediminum]|uniref:ABC transporter substrate-binding protein n=1 Tax=Verticiella sediminum TaxID=1247510 RepID=A0A556AKH0_9BURK|nr:ABC transporter substrate-binding protein [Verticiella sediminum]TSH93345.1 ABC transporter substrate-binding protein [Verticiella sediminum]
MKLDIRGWMAAALVSLGAASPLAHAQPAGVTIGLTLSTTGPGASLGIPERNAFELLPDTLGGLPVRYVVLDDATDPGAASRNARRLVQEHRVDAIVGSSTTPATLAVTAVAAESGTLQIALSPFRPAPEVFDWVLSLPQSIPVMSSALFDDMKAHGVKTLGFIGFADSYGEVWLNDVRPRAKEAGIELVAVERYARTDSSVTAQTLKLAATRPDAVLVVASGTPGALPMVALRDRGYAGRIYQTHGVANNDFLRVAGKSAEGAVIPAGALLVAEQLPAAHPSKEAAGSFVRRYEARHGAGSRDLFAGYAWDAYLILDEAVPMAARKARPGTAEFRTALRDAVMATRGLAASHGVINVAPEAHSAYGEDGRVLVTVEEGKWKLMP